MSSDFRMVGFFESHWYSHGWTLRGASGFSNSWPFRCDLVFECLKSNRPTDFRMVGLSRRPPRIRMAKLLEAPRFSYGWALIAASRVSRDWTL